MKRKACTLLLVLSMTLSLSVPALASEAVTPTPPEWVPEEEYAMFEGSAVYEPENWAVLTQARSEVAWGEINIGALSNRQAFDRLRFQSNRVDLGAIFEMVLVETRLLYTHGDYINGPYRANLAYYVKSPDSEYLEGLTDQQRYVLLLWSARNDLRYYGVGEHVYQWLDPLFEYPQFSLDVLVRSAIFSEEEQAVLKAELEAGWNAFVRIYLDGAPLEMDVDPEIRNERTMVPIRAVAEALGADVEWMADTQQIVMTRAGSTVTMTLDQTTAAVDGKAVEMDVAPYATEGRTLIPARYVAEFFGQTVTWDGKARRANITEDKSVAGASNLEAWALPMGAMLVKTNYKDPTSFGFGGRATTRDTQMMPVTVYTPWEYSRDALSRGWSIQSREDLIATIQSMTYHGHNDNFREMAADVKLRSEEERAAITQASEVWPAYMWEYTEKVDEKWGDKGILAWDLFRMSNLVQWGYNAGYLTYAEALEQVEPAAALLCETFSSWDEAYENYLDGYYWWARENVLDQDIWETQRGKLYLEMKADPAIAPIFDDALFQTGVLGLPEA